MTTLTPIEEELFANRLTGIAREMGEMLARAALSTNVKERRDFSCAVLDGAGRLVVNAPHIPVHLGALGVCVRAVSDHVDWQPGDVVITNHPAFGGSHLPDVTVITPVFAPGTEAPFAFAASRAHHAEIGGIRPGSMPSAARCLEEEGVVLAPFKLVEGGVARWGALRERLVSARHSSRNPEENLADAAAAVAANRRGVEALLALRDAHGSERLDAALLAVRERARLLAGRALASREGLHVRVEDALDDGWPLAVDLRVEGGRLAIDFTGTGGVHPGNLNATPAIVHSVVLYVLRLMLGEDVPLNEGIMELVSVRLPSDSLLDPDFTREPAPAVVGGNVETSQRLADLLVRGLRLQAGSQATMNNVLFGDARFGYYETIAGGAGASVSAHGASAVHTHMTNTKITDPEVIEHRYPVLLREFSIRRGSGGAGAHRGGDGARRVYEFLRPVSVSVLTQRRAAGPPGIDGGSPGSPGRQWIERASGEVLVLGSSGDADAKAGERLIIETPGGGGWGTPPA